MWWISKYYQIILIYTLILPEQIFTSKIKAIRDFCKYKFYDENKYCGIGLKTVNSQCQKWKHSQTNYDKHLEKTTLCKGGWFYYYCSTKPYKKRFNIEYSYDYCADIKCKPNGKNYCHSNISWSSTISTINLYFNNRENDFPLILLRYDDDDNVNCYVNKICADCQAVNKILENQLKPCQVMKTKNQTIIIENLLDNTVYSFYLIPVINANTIGTLIQLDLHTEFTKPLDIIVWQRTMNSISLKWSNNGRDELDYSIEIKGVNYTKIIHTFGTTYDFKDLLPCTEYCFSYWVIQNKTSNWTCTNTEFKFGDLLPIYRKNAKSQLIEWNYTNENNCKVVFNVLYYPIKFPNETVFIRTENSFLNVSFSTFDRYIVKVRPEILNKYGEYSEVKNFNITEFIRASKSSKKEIQIFLLIGLVVFIILSISLFGFCLFKLRNNSRNSLKGNSYEEIGFEVAEYFDAEVSIMCSKTDRLLQQLKIENFLKNENVHEEIMNEFQNLILKSEKLKDKLYLTTNVAQVSGNMKENCTFSDVPYDYNRVILQNHSTKLGYYNASFIPYYDDTKRIQFIACQSPINECVFDFWLMVWQQNISVIIMLGKFCRYWPGKNTPKNISIESTEFFIELDCETKTDAYIERKFIFKKKDENESRKIIHLQMISWSKLSNPKFEDLHNFHSRYNQVTSIKLPPYLIHSSSVDGTVGTFIAIDRLVNKIKNGTDLIDIYSEVSELRRQRPNMVQEKTEYLYIYEFLCHFINKDQENPYMYMKEPYSE